MSRFFCLSLHSLQNFEVLSSESLTRLHKSAGSPEPSLITFALSTSQYGFIMLESSDKHEKKNPWGLGTGRTSIFRTRARVVLLI